MKNKEPATVLKAMKKSFERDYVSESENTLKTDSGTEFKGVFHKWLYDENIYHKVAPPHRHSSLGNVESLNRQLGRLFNDYMNKMEEKTGKRYNNWTDIVGTVRAKLNAARKKELPKDINEYEYPVQEDLRQEGKRYVPIKPKYRVGSYVYHYLDHPVNALGHQLLHAERVITIGVVQGKELNVS
jgi:hypothetical protein